eukprot:6427547-Heterocapsa_arctica.AAC.1
MRTDCGALTCSMMLTNLNSEISNTEPWIDRSGKLMDKPFSGVKSTKSRFEVYCYSMNMQTIDGGEFISEKCIRLLYCNKSKWGDTGHHYDLMHPMIQQ